MTSTLPEHVRELVEEANALADDARYDIQPVARSMLRRHAQALTDAYAEIERVTAVASLAADRLELHGHRGSATETRTALRALATRSGD